MTRQSQGLIINVKGWLVDATVWLADVSGWLWGWSVAGKATWFLKNIGTKRVSCKLKVNGQMWCLKFHYNYFTLITFLTNFSNFTNFSKVLTINFKSTLPGFITFSFSHNLTCPTVNLPVPSFVSWQHVNTVNHCSNFSLSIKSVSRKCHSSGITWPISIFLGIFQMWSCLITCAVCSLQPWITILISRF